ncbi:MAG: 6-phosphogluconolactonase [Oscillospiraceae bacterium]|jgi:glucosamine-6-phosphate deaminase|nr:6-phosphogluconolactonase [Oscillospiraceae bacterium]
MTVYQTKIENLSVAVYPDRARMGAAAAQRAGEVIRRAMEARGEANVIFAAAPSQNEMLDALAAQEIDWGRVRAFQQDEYIGLPSGHPAGFGSYLEEHIFRRLPFKEVCYMGVPAPERAGERCAQYAALLAQYPPDLILLGFGENGHLAFNDPPVADFGDPEHVKVVELEERCRLQQVHDGCFARLAGVPTHAMTLPLPAIMAAPAAVVTVPGARKADAVRAALAGPVETACPASILRQHPDARLYLNRDSAAKAFAGGKLGWQRIKSEK